MKKVLIITYYWPPSGGSGVQRWLKYVKYLGDFGIQPIVLTVEPKDAIYPNEDISLAKDIPSNIDIHYAKAQSPLRLYQNIRKKPVPKSGFSGESKPNFFDVFFRFIRGNFYIPDARKGWNKHAFEYAIDIIKKNNIDTVITSSPPHSSQLIGLKLKQELKLKWICDLRDPWTGLFYNKTLYQTSIAKWIDKNYESQCLKAADEIIVVSKSIAKQFINSYPELNTKMNIIPNGYDPDDFQDITKTESKSKYISYIGSLGEAYPIENFIGAFKTLSLKNPNWKLRFVGNISGKTKNLIEKSNLELFVEVIPYKPHQEAVEYMVNSSILLLIIPEIEENEGILTGKLFEYIASGASIILIGPINGDAAAILSEFDNVKSLDYSEDIDLSFITKELCDKHSEHSKMKKYSRIDQSQKISQLINKNK